MSEQTDYMASAHYPFAFAIDIHIGSELREELTQLAAPGITEGELTIRVGYFMDAPASWHRYLGVVTGAFEPGEHKLNGDDAAAIRRQVRMVLADPDLAQAELRVTEDEAWGTHYWDNLSELGAVFDRLVTAPHDHRLSYVILMKPGMPEHIERIIRNG